MQQQLCDGGAYRSARQTAPASKHTHTHTRTHTRMQSSYISGLRGCVQYIPRLNPLHPPKLEPIPDQHVAAFLILLNSELICSVLLVLTLLVVGVNTKPVRSSTKCAVLLIT